MPEVGGAFHRLGCDLLVGMRSQRGVDLDSTIAPRYAVDRRISVTTSALRDSTRPRGVSLAEAGTP